MIRRSICVLLLLQIVVNCGIANGGALKVNLIVEPPAVRKGQHATLRCLYDLGSAPLYSIKFYRGLREFYRYSPSEEPANKIFAFPGINVDKSQSNASQVVIRNVGFGLSGNFSCEVTADAPYFSTATAAVQLQVVEYPEKRPYLWADQDRYEPGDVLRANCSSPPSRPRTELKFTLNNIVIQPTDVQNIFTPEGLYATRISLKLQLQSSHFRNHHMGYGQLSNSISVNGGLVLRCTAQIGNLYQEYSEIELGVPQRDPIPARVTSSGATRLGLHSLRSTNFTPHTSDLVVAATVASLISTFVQHFIHHSSR
ncbi:unnamed protein product [Hermetia illucens]|uniref:Ig-like domain-containing protein n=2 Tax=Hermetia illucens TaxID=343691 RepID=A0A7R8V1R1_HERIL|nr:unnamed protein product [Hermetia illucens]